MTRTRQLFAALGLVALVATAGACSSDDKDDDKATTTTEAAGDTTVPKESAATIRFDKAIQEELAEVGCHPGAADGVIGPKTDAAILAFQTADGIEADGELGPETEAALKKAVSEGRTVCGENVTTTTSATTTTAAGGTAPCTASALLGGLPDEGESIGSYVCSEGWAAGTLSDGTTKFILQSDNGKWYAPSQDPCGSASAGLPPVILEDGCPA
ncbi:MAG: peptidoglycan-binding protein [Actinomycetota bacterium]|nr:peptidoglycan-binding protein [Actinomycetota bacterium]